MGLGKTIQILSLCCENKPDYNNEWYTKVKLKYKDTELVNSSVLIVAPKSVYVEWTHELDKHTNGLNIMY